MHMDFSIIVIIVHEYRMGHELILSLKNWRPYSIIVHGAWFLSRLGINLLVANGSIILNTGLMELLSTTKLVLLLKDILR